MRVRCQLPTFVADERMPDLVWFHRMDNGMAVPRDRRCGSAIALGVAGAAKAVLAPIRWPGRVETAAAC
jgi:hypothetical protein